MKKLLFASAIALAVLSSCMKDDYTNKNVKCEATTLDAANVTLDDFTLNASFEISGKGDILCRYGIALGDTSEADQYVTEYVTVTEPRKFDYSYKWGNNRPILPSVPVYIFQPGSTVYFRAFVEILNPDGDSKYVYGQTKSFTLPEE